MSILLFILQLFIALFAIGILYWIFQLIHDGVMFAAAGLGCWLHKKLRIQPQEKETSINFTLAFISSMVARVSLMVWALFGFFAWFWEREVFADIIMQYAGMIWGLSMIVAAFFWFFLGLLQGRLFGVK